VPSPFATGDAGGLLARPDFFSDVGPPTGLESIEGTFLDGFSLSLAGSVNDAQGNQWWRVSRAFWNGLFSFFSGSNETLFGSWGWIRWVDFMPIDPAGILPNGQRALAVSTQDPSIIGSGLAPCFVFSAFCDILRPGDSLWIGNAEDSIYILEMPGAGAFNVNPPPSWSLSAFVTNEVGLSIQRRANLVPG